MNTKINPLVSAASVPVGIETNLTTRDFDVAVIGGGPSGLTAAVQAARAGARTLLVEKSGILGGTTTLAGVNAPGIFHAWGHQIIRGIGWEWVEQTQRFTGQQIPDFSAPENRNLRHWQSCFKINVPVYAALADRLVINAGVELWLHTMLAETFYSQSDKTWLLRVCQKDGLKSLKAKVLIDCTGDANAVALAGFGVRRPDMLQPGTLIFRASGYDVESLDLPALEAAFLRAVGEGAMERSDFYVAEKPVSCFLRNRGVNAMHVTKIDATTSEGKTEAELRARATLLRIVRFLRTQPGLANFAIEHMSSECGIRETVTIDGELCITGDDYASGRVWGDSLCHSFFPIDIHNSNGGGVDTRPLAEGILPTIPLRSQLPRGSLRLIVAGRTICSDREANSALRVQATAMATGQVAGATAALAAARDCDLRDVRLAAIRELLAAHGAIVPILSEEPSTRVLPIPRLACEVTCD